MATTAARQTTVRFSGDVVGVETYVADENVASPATTTLATLAIGPNTITPPSGGGTNVALTIVPPVGNTSLITLKGVAGDTGIPLHLTDPTVIAVDTTLTTLVLNAAAEIIGVRLQWN